VKIELESKEEKIATLRKKQALKEHRIYHHVYLRSSQSEMERKFNTKLNLILENLPNLSLKMTRSGHLVHMQQNHYPINVQPHPWKMSTNPQYQQSANNVRQVSQQPPPWKMSTYPQYQHSANNVRPDAQVVKTGASSLFS
jgi:hypothetical protein